MIMKKFKNMYYYFGPVHRKELYEKCFTLTKDGEEISIDEFNCYINELVDKEIKMWSKENEKKKKKIKEKTSSDN